jgi:RNA polymerase sigma-70 factor, ECF subfamily
VTRVRRKIARKNAPFAREEREQPIPQWARCVKAASPFAPSSDVVTSASMNADQKLNGDRVPATEQRGQSDVDPSVIASAARGDAVAFGQIYAQIAPRVRRYVRTIIRNPWDAEDVTQDAFVKLLTGIGRYDPARGTFSAWSLRIARNTAIDHIRAHRGGIACAEVDQRAPVDDAGRRCRESLRLVLSDLNPNQREILVLRALAGFEPSEIADYANATRGSINTLYHRASLAARDRLRAIDAGPCTRTMTKRSPEGAPLSRAA